MTKTALLIRSNGAVERLRYLMNGINQQNVADVYVVLDCTTDDDTKRTAILREIPDAHIINLTKEFIEKSGLTYFSRSTWQCGDYFYYAAFKHSPEYDFYWLLDDDIVFNVDFEKFLTKSETYDADLMGFEIGKRGTHWSWHKTMSRHYPNDVYGMLYPLSRLSRRAVKFLFNERKNYDSGLAPDEYSNARELIPQHANDEAFTATTLKNNGFTTKSLYQEYKDEFTGFFSTERPVLYEEIDKPHTSGKIIHPVCDVARARMKFSIVLAKYGFEKMRKRADEIIANCGFETWEKVRPDGLIETRYEKLTEDSISNNFDQFAFTKEIYRLINEDKAKEAFLLIESTLEEGHLPEDHYRIKFAKGILKSYGDQEKRADATRRNNPEKIYEELRVEHSDYRVKIGTPPRLSRDLIAGKYESLRPTYPLIEEFCTQGISDEDLAIYNSSRFDKPSSALEIDRVFIEKNCRISAMGHDDCTIVTGDNKIHPSRSGRVAKISGKVVVEKAQRSLTSAIVLPFPHASGNFFHSFAEMVYGLRYAAYTDSSTPIIYENDPYKLLPFYSRILDINPERLTHTSEVRDAVIETAYLPDVPPFYWSGNFVNFFRSAAIRKFGYKKHRKDVYISREFSSRSAVYEQDLQVALKDIGFDVVHAEKLSLTEQLELFINCDRLIAPHGAGLTNAVFLRDSAKILEIFEPDMVPSDFFQRSKFITPHYTPIINRGNDIVGKVTEWVKS